MTEDQYTPLPVADFKNNPMWVCSMCLKLARVYALQPDNCPGCGYNDCAHPYRGGCFRRYEGPLTEDLLRKFCFFCGEPSVMLVGAAGAALPRAFGVCKLHTPDRFDNLKVAQETPQQEPSGG